MSTPPGDQPPYDPNNPYGGQPPSYDPGQGGYGQAAPPPGGYGSYAQGSGQPSQATNGLAITALILGILGLLGNCFCFGGILSPVAAVLGFMGKKKADSGQAGGRGMALAGLILGVLGTLILLGWIGFIIYAISTGEDVNWNYSTDFE